MKCLTRCNVILLLSNVTICPSAFWNCLYFKGNALFSRIRTRLLLPLGFLPAGRLGLGNLITEPHCPSVYGLSNTIISFHGMMCIFWPTVLFLLFYTIVEDNGTNMSLSSCFFSLRECLGFLLSSLNCSFLSGSTALTCPCSQNEPFLPSWSSPYYSHSDVLCVAVSPAHPAPGCSVTLRRFKRISVYGCPSVIHTLMLTLTGLLILSSFLNSYLHSCENSVRLCLGRQRIYIWEIVGVPINVCWV